MNPGPQLVIKGAFLGSLLVGILGFLISAGTVDPPSEKQGASPAYVDNGMSEASSLQSEEHVPPNNKREFQDCRVSQKFPKRILRWCALITAYSKKQELPPDLVAALIWQESGGNPEAYSRSGAVGLMQIMPRDGLAANYQCVSGPCFANRPSVNELKDPQYNLKVGTRLLAFLIKKHGDTREALKAYGPMDYGYAYADQVLKIYKQYGER